MRPLTSRPSYWPLTRLYYWVVAGDEHSDHFHYAEMDEQSAAILRESLAERYCVSGVIPITRREYLKHQQD